VPVVEWQRNRLRKVVLHGLPWVQVESAAVEQEEHIEDDAWKVVRRRGRKKRP